MATLFNAQTRRPENLPEDQIEQALLSGTHGYQVNDRINVKKKDGSTVSLPGSELNDALASGEYALELPRQAAVREYVDENKGLSGQLKTAVTQFADEALMGIPEIIADKTQSPLDVAKRQALKKENEISNALGGIGGFAASLLYGGPVGKTAMLATRAGEKAIANKLFAAGASRGANAAAKSLAKKISGASAKMGVEGAVYAAPTAITEASLGDPELAAETLLVNGLAGGIFGGASSVLKEIGKLAGRSGGGFNFSDSLKKFTNEKAAKALGFSKGQIKKLENGIDEARDIGDTLKNMSLRDGTRVLGALDSPETISKNVKQARAEIGERIGDVYKQIDETGIKQFDAQSVKDSVEKKLGSFYKSKLNKDEVGYYNAVIETLEDAGERGLLTLGRGREILDDLDRIAFPGGRPPVAPTPKQALAREVRKIVRNELNAGANRGASLLGDGAVAKTLNADNKLYSKIIKADRAIDDMLSSQYGNKSFGLTDVITGVGLGSVNPALGLATVVGKKLAERYGNQFLANIDNGGLLFAEKQMSSVAKKLDEIPSKIESMLKGKKISDVARTSSVGAIQRLLENTDSAMGKVAAFNDLSEKLAEINTNPEYTMQKNASITTPISETGAPETANQLTMKNAVIAKYLDEKAPKPLRPASIFKQTEWQPSDAELASFERRIHAIQNPLSLIDDLQDGTLSTEAVDAVKAVYPKLFQEIQGRVLNFFMEKPQTVPYGDRLKLSLLLDMPLDDDLRPESIRNLQFNFSQQDEAAQSMRGGGQMNLPTMQTETQKVSMN